MAGTNNGIIDPPIDSLLEKVDSKYQLVIYASKRARQINDYYSDLHEGNLFDNVGPLVDSTVEDKPLTIAMHEIHEDKLRLRSRDAYSSANRRHGLRRRGAGAVMTPCDARIRRRPQRTA